ncbi:MAG: sigma factor-like helix-turn-helix DNA-binding protein, partial [Eubacteriales bacterium]|nr:sigma factor-like helix-turn-helix DNA-binding protein [Eubacteriales bacterium]MDD4513397.1 sigma factor-like helix-turn-helix DNA-binding protein [Eubacteriales bacterium]
HFCCPQTSAILGFVTILPSVYPGRRMKCHSLRCPFYGVQFNPLVEQLLTLMEKLTPQQIDLIYDLFGSGRQLTEIANEEGVSTTAIHNRKSKIIARLRKLFAEQGIL